MVCVCVLSVQISKQNVLVGVCGHGRVGVCVCVHTLHQNMFQISDNQGVSDIHTNRSLTLIG